MSANDQNNSEGGRLIICFKDKDKSKAPITLETADADYLKKLNKEGYGIFETANSFFATDEQLKAKTFKTKRHKEFLVRLNEVFADLDICKDDEGLAVEEREKRKKELKDAIGAYCPASVYVITKNGLQPRWWLDEEKVDLATQYKYVNITNGIIQWSIQKGAKGDPVKDVTRVLRKAGYYHLKSDPYLVSEERGCGRAYTLDELQSKFRYEPPQQKSNRNEFSAPSKGQGTIFQQVAALPIEKIVIDVWSAKGHTTSFDKDGHLIIDGAVTATFKGRHGDGNYIATTSGDYPAKGNAVTYVAETLGISRSEAFKKICSQYGIERGETEYREPLIIISAEDLCNQDFPTVEWTIHRLIPENQITVISGAPSSFKTMSAMEWAIQVSSGGKAFGFFNTTQSNVLLINEDGDHKRIIKKRTLFLTDKPSKNLFIMAGLGFKIEEERVRELAGIIKKHEIKFVILDSFRGIMPPEADEKDANAVRQIIDTLRILTDAGATLLILHHDRKKPINLRGYTSSDPNDLGEMMSGSADIRGAVDCHLAMGSAKNKKDGSHYIIVTQTKCREDELLPAFKVNVITTKDDAGKTVKMELLYEGEFQAASADETLNRAKEAILEMLSKSADKYVWRQTIIENQPAGLKGRTIEKAFEALENEKRVSSALGGELGLEGASNRKYYFLPDEMLSENEPEAIISGLDF
ncbi:hypothetical protein A2671_00505 [Candidatus Kaiserbacteria bacterium RIFCSPHIGHO2_01_FULL_49_13]|uniref:AAA+ ATPase domain-containing protein n=1 Tax=Candidatus Kaiserbacteria bacterium RIFCSPHIGHO2_01_FULL_49_13 TaxID=1798477 RepID=A0A1F6CCW0_9BACT|nr:MAG: hypothetical protein A2671_00505 [Candidatus Kaiserbacteria bacterium RIFCSPHIGHO2_01_FULL_49_13]